MVDQRLAEADYSKPKKPRSSGENPEYTTDQLLRILEVDILDSDFESSGDDIESDIESEVSDEEAALNIEDDNEDIPDTGISWVTGSSGMRFFPFTKSERLLTAR